MDANLLHIVPETLTETSRVKKRQKYRDAQSHVFGRFPPLSTRQQRYQGHESFRGVQKKTYRDREKRVFSSKLPTMCNVRYTQTRRENNVQQRRRKHGQREILESRDIRQVPNKRRVEVQSQSRDSLIRDVCTCHARRATNGRLAERRGRATANPMPSRGHCPSPQTRVSRGSDTTSRAGARILRFCPRRALLRPLR